MDNYAKNAENITKYSVYAAIASTVAAITLSPYFFLAILLSFGGVFIGVVAGTQD